MRREQLTRQHMTRQHMTRQHMTRQHMTREHMTREHMTRRHMTGEQTDTRDRRWLALAILCAGTLMTILDGTIVTVALPTIQRDLGFSQSSLAWVVNAYLIAFGGLLLLAGRLGDLAGRKRIFVAGLTVFTAASLWCGLSDSQAMLIVARFAQGAGGALTTAVVLGMITTMFPEPRLRARAIGGYSFAGAAGASVGVLAGGLITQAVSWHWIFIVNVPLGAAAIAAAARVIEPDRGIGLRAGADAVGAVLVTAGLMLGVDAVVEVTSHGWASARTLGAGAAAAALLAAFAWRQATAARPLLPLRIFRSREVSAANLVQALMVAGMLGFQFVLPLYLRRVLGYGPAATGLAFLPITIAIAAISLGLAPRLITRFGARALLFASLPLLATGLAALSQDNDLVRSVAALIPVLLLLGIGAGFALPAVTTLVMSAVTPEDSGVVSGLANTTQQVGGAAGVAIAATLATWRTGRLLDAGTPAGPALAGGYHLAFGTGAGLIALGLVVAAVALRPDRRPRDLPPTPRTPAGRATDREPQPARGASPADQR
jgi:EmrB/QacA subfamily drug resistance transporter